MTEDRPVAGPLRPARHWSQSLTLALLAVSVLLAGMLLYNRLINPSSFSGTAYPSGRMAPALEGTGEDGQPLSLTDLRGQTVAVFYGFLNCPNICPTTLAALERVRQALPASRRPNFTPLLVSVDPRRDTAAGLKQYVEYFSVGARGLRVPEAQLKQTVRAWGADVQYVDVKGPRDYQVNHTTGVYLVDARAGFAWCGITRRSRRMRRGLHRMSWR
ncbi:SCO family protein [Deinococcus metalli]|uniref:SCO family protein n=1 Tax=Deinococcus metalli TaxID=1141878 RepID=UPI00360FF502